MRVQEIPYREKSYRLSGICPGMSLKNCSWDRQDDLSDQAWSVVCLSETSA